MAFSKGTFIDFLFIKKKNFFLWLLFLRYIHGLFVYKKNFLWPFLFFKIKKKVNIYLQIKLH